MKGSDKGDLYGFQGLGFSIGAVIASTVYPEPYSDYSGLFLWSPFQLLPRRSGPAVGKVTLNYLICVYKVMIIVVTACKPLLTRCPESASGVSKVWGLGFRVARIGVQGLRRIP